MKNMLLILAAVFAFGVFAPLASAQTQDRMSDKDIESLMKNVINDTKTFRTTFDSGVNHSTIRKTSQAKDAKNLVETFLNQANTMLTTFQSTKKADDSLNTLSGTAAQIDQFLGSVQLGPQTGEAWSKVKSELEILRKQFFRPQS